LQTHFDRVVRFRATLSCLTQVVACSYEAKKTRQKERKNALKPC